ncbi:hypothetical protein [Rhodanobacter sp. A1T4]|uniref:hypothetical protein n=1 Tax=Rhodanobacter sp. A1T4 TaxID=2723087 RepID=UPI0016188EF1|nr:hypothetical protein [Rhodanobacter sp. A1T4]MBB6246863.1 hypothetical protein [Rhodanobacter sp. A1T4]
MYLDHWALDGLGNDPQLAATMIAALRTSGGTLCFSVMNAMEACKPSDPKHARRIDTFLAAVMPQVAVVEVARMALSEGIVELNEGKPLVFAMGEPPLDMEQALAFASLLLKPDAPGLFETAWLGRDRLAPTFMDVSASIAAQWNAQRQQDEWREQARGASLGRNIERARIVMGDLMRPAVIDVAQSIPDNDGADCMHALALPYCDFVLLDRTWAARAESTRQRLAKHGVKIGKAISQHTGGVPKLIEELLAWGKDAGEGRSVS